MGNINTLYIHSTSDDRHLTLYKMPCRVNVRKFSFDSGSWTIRTYSQQMCMVKASSVMWKN